jgi:hypothetical protein
MDLAVVVPPRPPFEGNGGLADQVEIRGLLPMVFHLETAKFCNWPARADEQVMGSQVTDGRLYLFA